MEGNVSISYQALEQVFAHSVKAGNVEVGGLLAGTLDSGRVYITRAIPTSRGTFTRIPITSQDMVGAAEKLNQGEQLVGWYHSHPGHTVFFSQDDIEAHETFLGFNPYFQALVIDPYQARRGDLVADCVKFFTVRNRRSVSIDDYRIVGPLRQDCDPAELFFDQKSGFLKDRPQVRVGITEADEMGLRQTLGTIKSERDELEDRYVKLRKGYVHVPRKAFPLLLIFFVLVSGYLGFIIGMINTNAIGGNNEMIRITEASLDWEKKELNIKANFDGIKLDKNEYTISIYLLDSNDGEIGKTDHSQSIKASTVQMNVPLQEGKIKDREGKDIDFKDLKDCRYIRLEIPRRVRSIQSSKFELTHICIKIEGTEIKISNNSLTFNVILYGPLEDSTHPFCVYLVDSVNGECILFFESEKCLYNTSYFEVSECPTISSKITITLKIKDEMIGKIEGQSLSVKVFGINLRISPSKGIPIR